MKIVKHEEFLFVCNKKKYCAVNSVISMNNAKCM